ncbi:transcriptional regulator [Paenibacillus sp. 28ISP30-2]|uniref:winged helix-turn-helix transcriptional regulator n=1 Tax=Paenibacillus sp. 23TSA30-6 TaxID=2546104 RepID=UPI00178806A2|nr:helix-turn-helix domain-containing protein [Paenibacillus sp. 23TSA30-6]MBE0336673.1 transcriptional regulator [Paenibacillus sp. 23TSA30-6]MBE0340868.1 transcriptional regulator [Paenibacillus sp. 28ISP30-2]
MKDNAKTYMHGIEATLEVIGGKWKATILYHLTNGRKRTYELRQLIPKITQKVLTQQLRELEKDEIIHRIIYNQVPPKVEYELSEYGWDFKDLLDRFCLWGEEHLDRVYGDKTTVLEEYSVEEPCVEKSKAE